MIINSSRAQLALKCWKETFNRVHRQLGGPKAFSLTDGAAMHRGIAYGLAKKDWAGALVAARESFDEDKKAIKALPEEEAYIFDNHWQLVEKMIDCYREGFEGETYQILQPECEFDVKLPGTEHNCVWMHHIQEGVGEVWGPPNSEAILAGIIHPAHRNSQSLAERVKCPCWQPHRLVGRTDGLALWNKALWLLEHKSSAISGENFWSNFRLTIQPTIYIYGIWKHLGLKPSGVLVNLITKPSEAQVANYNSKRKYGADKTIADYVTYSREGFLRTDEDLLRVEQQMIDLCNEWEWRIVNGKFPMSNIPQICTQYNRLCDFHGCCTSHDAASDLESLEKADPGYYVDVKLAALLETARYQPKETA